MLDGLPSLCARVISARHGEVRLVPGARLAFAQLLDQLGGLAAEAFRRRPGLVDLGPALISGDRRSDVVTLGFTDRLEALSVGQPLGRFSRRVGARRARA